MMRQGGKSGGKVEENYYSVLLLCCDKHVSCGARTIWKMFYLLYGSRVRTRDAVTSSRSTALYYK